MISNFNIYSLGLLSALCFFAESCKTTKSDVSAATICRNTATPPIKKAVLKTNKAITIPQGKPYAFATKNNAAPAPLAEGAVKKVFPGTNLTTGEARIIGVPHCADDGFCNIDIMKDFEKERLLDMRLIGQNGTMVDVFASDEGLPLIIKDFAHGDTIKKLITNSSWDQKRGVMTVSGQEISGSEFKQGIWDMILAISSRPLKGENKVQNLQEFLSIAGYVEEISEDSTYMSMLIQDLNPANIIAQVDDGQLVFKIVDGNAAIGKQFRSTDVESYLEAVQENTWEVIKNIEGTRLFGILPDKISEWGQMAIPGIKNVPPARGQMEMFMTDLRDFLWQQQIELSNKTRTNKVVPSPKI